MSIFQKETRSVDYYDQILVNGYPFDLSVTVNEKRGDPSAIHCGRITVFEMTCEEELAAYYCDGQWYLTPDAPPFDDAFWEAAAMARDILVAKWSNPEKIRVKTEKTDIF